MATHGITVGVNPSTEHWQQVQIDKATTSTGVPSSGSTMWATFIRKNQTVADSTIGVSVTDNLPNDGVARHYRSKGYAGGYQDSTYGAVISATPTLLSGPA